MSEATFKPKVVRVKREQGEGGWFYATSPDLKGLLVAEPTLDALDRAIPGAISDLFAACGHSATVDRLERDEDDLRSWVAVPSHHPSSAHSPTVHGGCAD